VRRVGIGSVKARWLPRTASPARLAPFGALGASAVLGSEPAFTLPRIPSRLRLAGIALCCSLPAAAVGYLTAQNPSAAPSHVAVLFRVTVITSLVLAGTYALTDRAHRRMGGLLIAAGLYSSLWLLDGSSESVAFSLGGFFAALAVPIFYSLMLAHPSGHLSSSLDRVFVLGLTAIVSVGWAFAWLTARQPPISAPLLQCGRHCPHNVLFLGSTQAGPVVGTVLLMSWVLFACGTFLLLLRRLRSAGPPLRRSLTPVVLVAMVSMLSLFGFLVTRSSRSDIVSVLGPLYAATALLLPLAVLLGLALERQFMGQALAKFMGQLAGTTPSRLQALMADALHDPSLTIAYPRPRLGSYVDSSGSPVEMPTCPAEWAVTEIERDGRPIASVLYDAALADQEPFVRAAMMAAALRLEHSQLEADLKASVAELARSRKRLVQTADAERQRIERDLHDGAQQHLVGMRVKLELATDAIKSDREQGERMLAEIGLELDEALDELRSLAQGVYPPLLAEHGLAEALKSAARQCAVPVAVQTRGIGRYPADVEAAVYFCCREALQNMAKHAGQEANGTLRLWEEEARLRFEVGDSGVGFSSHGGPSGSGIVNMHDRLEAVGGKVTVSSHAGAGTVAAGYVPLHSSTHAGAQVPRRPGVVM
jgi:signal transduction histidine kinase